jgi:hypothetical protein
MGKTQSGGQGCFLGENDEYFAHCGSLLSEIAIAERGSDGWIGSELLRAESDGIVGYSNFQDLGTDGENLIVRIGSNYATDKPKLWVFSLGGEEILE